MIKEFLLDEEGLSTIEVILILLVIIGLIVLFKKYIVVFIKDIFSNIDSKKAELM